MNDARNYVFVGVSLQGKDNSKEMFSRLIDHAQTKHKMSKLVFLVADEIELINQRVFSKGHETSHRKRVEKLASEIEEAIKSAGPVRLLSSGRVVTCRWNCILDNYYCQKLFELKRLFILSNAFREDVVGEIKRYAFERSKNLSEGELIYLCDYILQELPTLINGVSVDGTRFNKMIYPAPSTARIDAIAKKIIENAYGDIDISPPYCEIDRFTMSSFSDLKQN